MPPSRPPDSPPADPPLETWLTRLLTTALILTAAIATIRPVLSPKPWMLFVEDDFFYYLKVAQNLAHGHGSTFNGLVHTNGYHPLWLLLLTLACAISSAPKFILSFVALVTFLSTITTYELTRRILILSGLPLLPASALAVYAAIYAIHILFGGMEILLTIPLVLLTVLLARRPQLWQTPHPTRDFALLGLASSAMILSRLDTLILAALLFLGLLSQPTLRKKLLTPSALSGLALGLLPVALYFLSNALLFGTLLPVSGMAKQLKTTYTPSAIPWASAFHHPPSQLINLLPILIALALVLPRWRCLSPLERALYPPVLAFPFLYIALLSIRSDWQLWGWYLYPFRTALVASFAVLVTLPVLRNLLANRIVTTLLLLFALADLHSAVWRTSGRETLYDAALDIQTFAQTHPGVYAMGDRSGMPAWLLPDPVIQTEGLVMDRTFLNSIRTQQPLLDTLARYHARYYIASSQQPLSGCFQAAEPAQAGPASPHMIANLCQPPLATFHHGDWYNFIYDLSPSPPPTKFRPCHHNTLPRPQPPSPPLSTLDPATTIPTNKRSNPPPNTSNSLRQLT